MKSFCLRVEAMGSVLINELVQKHLDTLLKKYIIFHQVGKSFYQDFFLKLKQLEAEYDYPQKMKHNFPRYFPFGFSIHQMPILLSLASVVICRSRRWHHERINCA